MMEPKFEPVVSQLPPDPLSARIDDVMGTDYHNYIHCRNNDSKGISLLIGKSADRFAQHSVDWGRPSAVGKSLNRARVDRSSGLYLTGTRKSVAPASKEQLHHERKPHTGQAASECAEDELRNDLYLSPSDDEDAPGLNCTPNNSQHSAHDSQQSHGIRDLSYWVKKGSEKLEKKAPPAEERKVRPGSPKDAGNYRELVKNSLDSLRSTLRTKRMLSVLNDTDDEGERKDGRPHPTKNRDMKRKSFVDCRPVGRSPKRELVPYSDLNEDDEEEEEITTVAPAEPEAYSASPAISAASMAVTAEAKMKTPPTKREVPFRFEARSAPFHVAFPVPPTGSDSPSHRKRPRRHAEVSPEPQPADVASTASPATDPMVDPTFERNLSDAESEPAVSPVKEETEKKNIFQALPKIPRKRPAIVEDAGSEAKKKARLEKVKEEEPSKPEETRESVKMKEKKARHKTKDRSKPKDQELIKRESCSPRAPFEMSVSDEPSLPPSLTLNADGMDSLAPILPRVTEVATQCELIPPVERDASETKDTKRLLAVAFRIAGGQARAGVGAQVSDTSGTSQAAAVTRRPSSASTVDEGEAGGRRETEEEEARTVPRCSDLLDAVVRHKRQQESIVQRENVYYQKMNAHSCFSDALDKKVEAERLKSDDPSRFALCALRACFLYIQACYVEERQSRSESASIHYREAVAYVRSTSQLIEQVAKAEPTHQRARVRHHFITLLCAQMKAVINYRIYCIGHRETARLRPEIERELHRLMSAGPNGGNGASERSTPESISRSPAGQQALQVTGECLHRLQRYFRFSRAVQSAHEYWIHAMTLRAKHEDLGPLEELVFRKAQVVCYGPECPVPCFLRYLNTFLTLYEEGEV